jgi:hypothetical protein
MIPSRVTGLLALPLTLLITFGAAPAQAQGPPGDPGTAPLSPGEDRPPAASAATLAPPTPLTAQGQPGPAGAPAATLLPPSLLLDGPSPGGPAPTDVAPPPATAAAFTDPAGGFASPFGGGGGKGLAAAFSPVVGRVPLTGSYEVLGFFDAPVRGQDTHLGYVQEDLNVRTPIWQCSTDEFYANARVAVESFDTHAVLPSTLQPFPAELWNVSLGAGYRHQFDNGWIGGGSVAVGSASDKPFHSIEEMTISATGFVRVPRGDRDAWVFGLSLSSNSQVLAYVPIPFVAYLWNPSDCFQAVVGFPFASATYRPWDRLTLTVSYALLTTFHARISYRIAPPVSVFCALDFDNENYYLADRADSQQRFFYYNDRLSGGVQVVLSRHASLVASGGYVFDRFYFEGTNFTDQSFNHLNVAPTAFLGARLQLHY